MPTHILLVRHAPAGKRETFARTGKADGLRPLTGNGRTRMRSIARALQLLQPSLDAIVSSPLTRAVQTADILSDRYQDARLVQTRALAPGADPADLRRFLARRSELRSVALVGHEPDLTELLRELLGDAAGAAHASFGKGGAALLRTSGKGAAAQAVLLWQFRPRLLRQLGEAAGS